MDGWWAAGEGCRASQGAAKALVAFSALLGNATRCTLLRSPDLSKMDTLFHMEGTPVSLVPAASLSFTKLICSRLRAGMGGVRPGPGTCLAAP